MVYRLSKNKLFLLVFTFFTSGTSLFTLAGLMTTGICQARFENRFLKRKQAKKRVIKKRMQASSQAMSQASGQLHRIDTRTYARQQGLKKRKFNRLICPTCKPIAVRTVR